MTTTYTDRDGIAHELNDCKTHGEAPFVQVVKTVQWGTQYLIHCKTCGRSSIPRTGSNMKKAAENWNRDNS